MESAAEQEGLSPSFESLLKDDRAVWADQTHS